MLNLKKTTIAVLAFTSSAVFSGTMGPVCDSGNVTISCTQKGWDIGGQALYLQSSLGALNFPYYRKVNRVAEFHNNNPWGWGFMVEGSYHFTAGKDINLNWYHVRDSQINSIEGIITSTSNSVTESGPLSISDKSGWDAVNLEFGKGVVYGQELNVRYYAGVEYVRLEHKVVGTAYPPAPVLGTVTRILNYNGFGPRVGVDAVHSFMNGLSTYAKTAVGLYSGSSRFSYLYNPSIGAGRIGSNMAVVPELEAKLGAVYTYSMAHGVINLDAGWMWINYFNSMTYGDDGLAHSANFSLQGPYAGLKWIGNFA